MKIAVLVAIVVTVFVFVKIVTNPARAAEEGGHTLFLPIIEKPVLLIADYNSCDKYDNLGGEMGAAYNLPDLLQEQYVFENGRGCVVRLDYQNQQNWSAFWMKIQSVSLVPYSQIVFDIKSGEPLSGQVKMELKRNCHPGIFECDEVWIQYFSNITTSWQTVTIDLDGFTPLDNENPNACFTAMEELVFTFEKEIIDDMGVVYIDNVHASGISLPCEMPGN